MRNRDSARMGRRPFRVWASALARVGVATLRADDRGVDGTDGNLFEADYEDLVGDVLAGLETLRARRCEGAATGPPGAASDHRTNIERWGRDVRIVPP